MARRTIARVALAFASLALLGSSGCTQDDRILSGNATAVFEAAVLSAPPERWDVARFDLFRGIVVALDPDARANFGSDPEQIDLVPGRKEIDLKDPSPQVVLRTPMPPGRYELKSLFWAPPTLSDPDADPNAPTCIEKIDVIPPPPTTGVLASPGEIPLDPPIQLTVPAGGTVRVVIEINAAGLVADYESRWICADGEFDRCGQAFAPCLRGWDSFGFFQALPQYVTVQVE